MSLFNVADCNENATELKFPNAGASPVSPSTTTLTTRHKTNGILLEMECTHNLTKVPNNKQTKKMNLKKGQKYLPSFKRRVLNYAVKHTFQETAAKFNINCNTLTEWAREYKRLLHLKKSTTKQPGSNLKTDITKTPNETEGVNGEVKFTQWLRHQRLRGQRLHKQEILNYAASCIETDNPAHWLKQWVLRLGDPSSKTDKRILYPHNFKMEVALFAKEYTKREASIAFGLSSRRVYEWCEFGSADEPNNPTSTTAVKKHVERQILHWYNHQRQAGLLPKGHEVSSMAQSLYAANGVLDVKCSKGWLERIKKRLNIKLSHQNDDVLLMWILSQIDENQSLSLLQVSCKAQELFNARSQTSAFKGSKGWTLRFLKRHNHLLQCTSARLSDLPAEAAMQAQMFCRDIQQRMVAAGLSGGSIGCMDEVALRFVYPSETVKTPGLLRKAELETAYAIVLLTATSDGQLLPPAVVFKGQRAMQTFHAYGVSMPVLTDTEGGVSAQVLQNWSQLIWLRNVPSPSMLVLDNFGPHRDPLLKQTLSAGFCHLAVIPPGCGLHLQPCAYNLSHRFQESIQEKWLEYTKGKESPERGSRGASPDEEAVLSWIITAYLALKQDSYSIRSSFELTGLRVPITDGNDLYIPKTEFQV